MRSDDLHTYLMTSRGEATVTEVLENIRDAVQRIEHVLALELVMRHGTPEQAVRAEQHLFSELAHQEQEHD